MTAWIVTGAVLLFFAVLFFSPVILAFSYKDGKWRAVISYLFIKIDFSPEALAKRGERKAKRAVKEEYKKQKSEEETADESKKEKRAASDTAKLVWSLLKACKKGMNIIRRHLIFYKIKVTVITGGGDSHKIAKDYGTYCTLAPNLISLLDSMFVVREPDITIMASFLLEKTWLDISFKTRIAPWYVLSAAAYVGIRVIKIILSNKQKRKKIKGIKNIKGGKRHESTASHK